MPTEAIAAAGLRKLEPMADFPEKWQRFSRRRAAPAHWCDGLGNI